MATREWTIRVGLSFACCAALTGPLAGQTTSGGTPEQVVQTQIAGFNRHDVTAMFAVEDPNGGAYVFDDSEGVHTKDSISKQFAGWFAQNPNATTVVTSHFTAGEFVVNHHRTTGTADGKPLDLIVIWQVKNGHVMNFWETPTPPEPATAASIAQVHAVLKRVADAIDRHDWDAAAAEEADTITYRSLGGPTVKRMSRSDMRAGFAQVAQQMPQMKHHVVSEMIVPPYVVQHERFTGKPDGTVTDAVDVFEVRDGHIVAEWESPW